MTGKDNEIRVLVVSREEGASCGCGVANVKNYEDITQYIYKTGKDGKLEKDTEGNLIPTGNKITVSLQEVDIGKGQKVKLYKASVEDKDGNAVNGKDGKPLVFNKTGLISEDTIEVIKLPVKDGVILNEKFAESLQRPVINVSVDKLGIQIEAEKAKHSSPDDAPGKVSKGIVALGNDPDKLKKDIKIEVDVYSQQGALFHVDTGKYFDDHISSDMGVRRTYELLEQAARATKGGKAGSLDDALKEGTELYNNLKKVAETYKLSFSKEDASALISFFKDEGYDNVKTRGGNLMSNIRAVHNHIENLGITESGTYETPGKRKTGWGIE